MPMPISSMNPPRRKMATNAIPKMNAIGKKIILAGQGDEIMARKGAILSVTAPHIALPTPKAGAVVGGGKEVAKRVAAKPMNKQWMEVAPSPGGRKAVRLLDPKNDPRYAEDTNREEKMRGGAKGKMEAKDKENVKKTQSAKMGRTRNNRREKKSKQVTNSNSKNKNNR